MDRSDGATLGRLLRAALAAEEGGRSFYLQMEQGFRHEPAVASFWQSMAKDETWHIAALEEIGKRLSAQALDQEVEPERLVGLARSLAIVSPARAAAIANLDDAYELAHEYESSEVNRVFELFASGYPASEDRREFMVREVREHQARLVEFGRNIVGRAQRRAIPIRSCADGVRPA